MKYAVGLFILLGSAGASAGEDDAAGKGLYYLFNLGSSKIGYDVDYMNNQALAITQAGAVSGEVESKVFSYSVQLGYGFHRNFGIEAGVGSLGESTYEGFTSDLESVDASASSFFLNASGVVMYPLTDSFELFAKVGLAWIRVDEDIRVAGPLFGLLEDSTSDSNSGLTYGIGIRWRMSDGFFLNAEYDSYDTGVSSLGKPSVFYVGFGLGY